MKKLPRLKRIAERDAAAAREAEHEKFVRSVTLPERIATAKKAVHAFNTEDRGKPRMR